MDKPDTLTVKGKENEQSNLPVNRRLPALHRSCRLRRRARAFPKNVFSGGLE
jgi:hypothetical protein